MDIIIEFFSLGLLTVYYTMDFLIYQSWTWNKSLCHGIFVWCWPFFALFFLVNALVQIWINDVGLEYLGECSVFVMLSHYQVWI